MTGPARIAWPRRLRIAAEIAIMFGGLLLLDAWGAGNGGLAGVEPHPFWLPVIVLALAYGTTPGLVAAGLASAWWLTHGPAAQGGHDYFDYLFHRSLQPLLWFVAALGIGEVTKMRAARRIRCEQQAEIATGNVARLTDAFDRLSETNRDLQVRVATDERTIGHVVATATGLSASDPAERCAAIGHLVALAARSEDFTCYRLTDAASSIWLHGPAVAGHRDPLPATLIGRLAQGLVHVARAEDRVALAGIGVAAVPLPGDGAPIGCLVFHSLPVAALGAQAAAEMVEIASWLGPLLAVAQGMERTPARVVEQVA